MTPDPIAAILAAIDQGDRASQLLDGREYDPGPWEDARAALRTIAAQLASVSAGGPQTQARQP